MKKESFTDRPTLLILSYIVAFMMLFKYWTFSQVFYEIQAPVVCGDFKGIEFFSTFVGSKPIVAFYGIGVLGGLFFRRLAVPLPYGKIMPLTFLLLHVLFLFVIVKKLFLLYQINYFVIPSLSKFFWIGLVANTIATGWWWRRYRGILTKNYEEEGILDVPSKTS
ncbi:MAG: hypothetical protein ACRBFS_08580 [Aureispira sp.]